MDRAMNNFPHRSADVPAKSPRARYSRDSVPAEPRQHRYRPGTRARMEIRKRHFREAEGLFIRRLRSAPLVRKTAIDYLNAPSFQPQIIESLQYEVDFHSVKHLECTNLFARHPKGSTV